MSSDRSHSQLRCTQLCTNMPGCLRQDCRFAHSLAALSPPDETSVHYSKVWADGLVHRWFGQAISAETMNLIKFYWENGPKVDNRPLWAIGLYLFTQDAEAQRGIAYPWDFGLVQDQTMLRIIRRSSVLPFESYPGLWARLQDRKSVLSASIVGHSILGYELLPQHLKVTVLSPSGAEPIPANTGCSSAMRRSPAIAGPRPRSRSPRREPRSSAMGRSPATVGPRQRSRSPRREPRGRGSRRRSPSASSSASWSRR